MSLIYLSFVTFVSSISINYSVILLVQYLFHDSQTVQTVYDW